MFKSPPQTSRHDTTTRTRSAWKKELLKNAHKEDPAHEIQSEILKKVTAETQNLAKRPNTDGGSLKMSVHTEKPASTHKSSKSLKSIEAQKKLLEYEAAKAKAEIEKKLIEEKLAADLAALEDRSKGHLSSRGQQSEIDSVEKVQQWLERSHLSQAENHLNVPAHTTNGGAEMKNLATAMYQANHQNQQLMARLAMSKDLPRFHGDALEWLTFKQAYDESTKMCNYSDSENMWRLRKSLQGEAKETVSSLLIGNTAPHTIMEALELRYGRPETIINKIIYQLRKIPPLSSNYHHEIVSFSIKIKNFVAAAQAVKQTDYLRSPELVSSVLTKCPTALINKWADYYSSSCNSTEKAKLEMLADFLYTEANKISVAGLTYIHSQADYKKKPEDRRQHSVHVSVKRDTSNNNCKFCRVSNHKLTECARFKRAMTKDRWRYVRVNRLCHKCLLAAHSRDTCSASDCGIEGCVLPHHRLLHWKPKIRETNNNSESDNSDNLLSSDQNALVNNNLTSINSATNNENVGHITDNKQTCVFLKVVPINLHGPEGVISTYALLDDGATVSLISADIADRVNIRGRKQTLCVRGAWNTELTCNSEVVDCTLANMDNETFKFSARKINELNLPLQKLSNINIKDYKHLKNISHKITCCGDVKPKILIGQDNYHLISPIKTIINTKNDPCATLTPLGWCVHGVCPGRRSVSSECAMITAALHYQPADCADPCRIYACSGAATNTYPLAAAYTSASATTADSLDHTLTTANTIECDCLRHPCAAIHTDRENDKHVHEFVCKFFMFESIGVHIKPRQNKDELKAISIIDTSAKLVEGRWEVGLPWREENAKMADSYCNAYRRLKTMEHRMVVDEGFASRYRERMSHLLINGYARKLEPGENKQRFNKIWYLPHFGVDNPNKKKLRLVYDAAATSAGQSLNDYLLPGPNLLESLFGIMCRFRERPIGLTGDIKDMFLRIKIKPEDQHALRFLWRDNTKDDIEKYIMTSLIFGANCSPFIAQHIKNKNAQQYVTKMPEAVEAIIKNHFMDDYIDCFESDDIALKTMKEVAFIHLQGDFEMRNWTSNNLQVCKGIPNETLSAAAVKFKVEGDSQSERTLGLLWFPDTDTFGFNLSLQRIPEKILSCEKRPTKQELLRIVMSIFDIYGFLAPFTIKVKIIMQNSWKSDIQWDDEIKLPQFEIFQKWIKQLQILKDIRIPRWYFRLPNQNNELNDDCLNTARASETLQLHVFCDASPTTYAAVAYWRAHTTNNVCISFIASKSRVAPIKPVTVPRMELQAAVLACRLADTIQAEHRLRPVKRYFWSDSTTVLHWIKNETRNYKQFVANRLGEIDELSQINEWHYVSTEKNIADIATKNNTYNLHNDCEWFRGPTFLYKKTDEWFTSAPEKEKDINVEILERVHNVYETVCYDLPVPDPVKFSSWLRLLRCVANVLLFVEKCKKNRKAEINTDLLQRAERLLLRHAQMQSFASDIYRLKNGKLLQSNSRLRTLTPYIDEYDVLRVGGRVEAAKNVSFDIKRPIILDGAHPIARLIVKNYHIKYAHGNNEIVVSELRQRYWLLRLRPTVRTVASKCQLCRIRRTSPRIPRMADLPPGRLAHQQRAFTHCGVDLFGPMEIKVGRHRERRYGVLFTCMTVRAIHIEMVPSLSTDSFIMALRRMACRRGWPQHMYSDNATNLRGAESELKRAMQELDESSVRDQLSNRGVAWTFISPISLHKGGAWERIIRSVKMALKVILKDRAPREETLITLLLEVENIVNSRPLTHVSVDPEHMEALTPNHFLIGSSSNLPIPGVFEDGDLYVRKMWRTAQRLTDMFWQRWVKEYLPELIPRQRWYHEAENLKQGDLVIIVDPNLPRNTWPKGIVKRVYPGSDGRIRTVDLKTKTGILTRPVARLALIPTVMSAPEVTLGGDCRRRASRMHNLCTQRI